MAEIVMTVSDETAAQIDAIVQHYNLDFVDIVSYWAAKDYNRIRRLGKDARIDAAEDELETVEELRQALAEEDAARAEAVAYAEGLERRGLIARILNRGVR